MKNKTQTTRKIVGFLNNKDEDGGFWLPNIQRPFVWSEDQICRLFDSILREYPISTLLVWKTTSKIRRRKFIDNWRSTLRLSDFYVPEDNKKNALYSMANSDCKVCLSGYMVAMMVKNFLLICLAVK
jgi:uncharacterized protein with ParB-like and HNH nuclease domain